MTTQTTPTTQPTTSAPVITRFAPSPTGHLHIGGARTALFCWAFAKRAGGRFMLRIEDTDAARSSDESARGIMEDLAWLGIEWDDGPALALPGGRSIGAHARAIEGGYFQARRVAIYDREIERLVKLGRAYPAFDTPEETEAQRKAAVAAKQTYRYPRPAEIVPGEFNAALQARWARARAGDRHVVRFVVPHEEVVVHDQVLGDVKIAPGELDDFVIRKADGFPTYHFAVVVDDETMGVTHVLRAQEHLANTPRHVAMQKALGYRTPVYGHMPLICNMDGSKMSKRDKAKAARAALQKRLQAQPPITADAVAQASGIGAADLAAFLAKDNDSIEIAAKLGTYFNIALPEIEVADFREAGYLPEAICNFLALLGWNPGMKTEDGKDLEKFDNAFLAKHFAIDRIGTTNSKFDRAKLLSFNADAMATLSPEEFLRRWVVWLDETGRAPEWTKKVHAWIKSEDPKAGWLVAAVKTRAKTFLDALRASAFDFRPDGSSDFDGAAVAKNLTANNNAGLGVLADARARLAAVEPFEPAVIHGVLEQMAQQYGGMGAVAQPIRVAIAGSAVSPPLGETLAVLGKPRTLARIDTCLSTLKT